MIAKLDNRNNNKSRHGWSEQKIHLSSSFPRKMRMPNELVLLNYSWNQVDTALSDPLDVLMTWDIASAPPIAKTQEIPDFCVLHRDGDGQTCKKPTGKGENIAHTRRVFPFWCANSNQKRTLPKQGQFLLIFASIRTPLSDPSGGQTVENK